jgi:hypothetical protein
MLALIRGSHGALSQISVPETTATGKIAIIREKIVDLFIILLAKKPYRAWYFPQCKLRFILLDNLLYSAYLAILQSNLDAMWMMSRICQYLPNYATSNLTGPLILLQDYIHGLPSFDFFAVLPIHKILPCSPQLHEICTIYLCGISRVKKAKLMES